MDPSVNPPPRFDVTVDPDRTVVRVAPEGELDVASRAVLDARLQELWEAGWSNVVVDLRGLTFMDSSGVHLLVDHHGRASAAGARLSFIDGTPTVARTLRLCGVDELLDYVQPEPQLR
jgi:anti-sigma B factor antagonist